MGEQELPRLPDKKHLWGFAAVLAVLGFVVYGASLANDFVRFDDNILIFENPAVRSLTPSSIKWIFTNYDPELYIPFTFISYQVLFQIGGLNATPYHIFSLLLHIGNAFMVAWLVFLLLKKSWAGAVAGLLFLVHPLNTEAVAWAAGLKDLQSAFFYLSSVLLYLYWRDDRIQGYRSKKYWISIALFVCALFSKVMAVTLPVILLLIDFFRQRKFTKEMFIEKIPHFALSGIFGVVALFGKREIVESVTPWQTMLVAARSATFYLQKFLLPTKLSVMYPYNGPIQLAVPMFWVSVLLVIIILVALFLSLKKTRTVFFGGVFYLLTVAPTFANFSKSRDVYLGSDRYAYFPSIGLFFLVCLLLSFLVDRFGAKKILEQGIALLVTVVTLAFGYLSFAQAAVWKSGLVLFSYVTSTYPEAQAAHNNLGNAYRRQEKDDEAMDEYKKALAVRESAEAYMNVGSVLADRGDIDGAEKAYKRAIELEPKRADIRNALAVAYDKAGLTQKALDEYAEAIRMAPDYMQPYHNRAAMKEGMGDLEGAAADGKKAVELQPFSWQSHYNLANVLSKLGKSDEAVTEYQAAIKINPSYVSSRLNLGVLLAKIGKLADARDQFSAVLRIDPGNQAARNAIFQIDQALGH